MTRLPGRVLALLGILLVALNVRTAVSSLSPIVDRVSAEIPLDELGLGVIGMLPPIAFAVMAILAPLVARRFGIEVSLALACAAMIAGPLLRAFAGSYAVLVLGSALALAGMGFGNVLLPPAVKKYFPDRIGPVTAGYVTLLAVSTAMAAALAEPVAIAAGWRVSLGIWAGLAAVALVPWVILVVGRRSLPGDEAVLAEVHLPRGIWRSGVARSLTLVMMVSALVTYAMFAWLPTLIADVAGAGKVAAGNYLALYSIVGLPLGLVVPVLAARVRRSPSVIIAVGAVAIVLSNVGLLVAPSTLTWLWVILGGLGGMLFPLVLAMINLRTRSTSGSVALSGFVQALAYGGGALGPLLLAATHDATDSWTPALVLMLVVGAIGVIPAFTLAKVRYVEDQLT
jgi:CP family cyanate transporter-like MFS transporter